MNDNMHSILNSYVKEKLEVKSLQEEFEKNKIRFTVTFDNPDNSRLEYIAKELGIKKTQLVADATLVVLSAFEEELGLKNDPSYYEKLKSLK